MIPATGRVLGVDLGSARIGVALSDSGQRVASALTTMRRSGDPEADRRALAGLVAEEEAVGVVVGLPRSLDGSLGPAAQAALDEVSRLGQVLCGVGVETVDERFTTVAAHQALRVSVRATAAGRAARGARRGREARGRVDSVAATILLQSWLDRRLSLRGVAR